MFGVIFVNEYLRRVKNRTFLLVTFLVPAGVVAVISVIVGLVVHSVESESQRLRERGIAVLDESGGMLPALREAVADADDGYRFVAVPGPLEAAKRAIASGDQYALLVLPKELAEAEAQAPMVLYVKERQSVTAEGDLRYFVLRAVRERRLDRYDLPAEARAVLAERLRFRVIGITDEGEEQSGSAEESGVIAVAIAMFVMVVSATYGGTVMQTVMEEKSSRMAEIVVSSASSFELLLGKILAVSAMAATQLGLWLAILACCGVVAAGWLGTDPGVLGDGPADELAPWLPSAWTARWDVILVALLMLPLGYFINASVFAALGALHENPWEAQVSVTLAMLPMLLGVIIAQTIMFAPNGPLVVIGSFFPFTAPAILPARMLLVDLPVWQTVLAIVTCAAAAIGMVWLCGRVFRGSLLIYGKKLTWRDLRRVIGAD